MPDSSSPTPRDPGRRAVRRRARRRRRRLAIAVLAAVAAAATAAGVLLARPGPTRRAPDRASAAATRTRTASTTATRTLVRTPSPRAAFAVGLRFETFVDHSRSIRLPSGTSEPRTLLTVVRYPALGSAAVLDRRDAAPARAAGPFPLVIFGHGFAVSPAIHAALLRAWTRAGYVVAAPVFPLENAHAPGGPNEADLVNQPADVRFVISSLLAQSRSARSALHDLIDPAEIAVTGQSDGGDTALAVAYDPPLRDRRVTAAVILSGATIPQLGPFVFPSDGPPLLATQGSADTINVPSATNAFFTAAHRPKYLLTLLGAPHLPPYTTEQPQLGIVERVTLAFLDRYLKGRTQARAALLAAGHVAGVATLESDP